MSFSVKQTSSCTLLRAGPALRRKFKRTVFSHTASHYRPPTHDSLFAAYLGPMKPARKKQNAILRSPERMLSTLWLSLEIISMNIPKYGFGEVQYPPRLLLTKSDSKINELWMGSVTSTRMGKIMCYPRYVGLPPKGRAYEFSALLARWWGKVKTLACIPQFIEILTNDAAEK